MTDKQSRRWRSAMNVARVAMGKNPRSKEWIALEDPLAWWCLTELLYSGVK